jgi:uncharacterized delta-60 repeat protein
MRRIALVLTGAVMMAVMLTINVSTALSVPQGSMDTSFGNSGNVTTDFGGGEDNARGIAIQPDGKLVTAGSAEDRSGPGWANDFALARYNSDGSLDTSFGNGGKVTTAFFGDSDDASDVALQDDGKIVVAGSTFNNVDSSWDVALARYNSDGSLDTSFGNGGKVVTDYSGGDDEARAVAIQQDGKIVAAGVNRQPPPGENEPSNYDFALARYNTDGSLDTSFDGDGKVTTDFAGWSDEAYAVALHEDGKIVAAGSAWDGTTVDVALARYNSDGSLDASLDGDGKVFTDFDSGWWDVAYDVALHEDGKIIAVGTTYYGDFALARYNTDGSLDTSFDGDGKITTDFDSGLADYANAVAVQQDGKIVAAGYTWNDTTGMSDQALARYNSDGSFDTKFNRGSGKVSTALGHGASIEDLAIQQDGKIVSAGRRINDATYYDFSLVRYQPQNGAGE